MTASSTRCSRNSPADAVSRAAEVLWRRSALWGLRWVLFVLLALCGQAQAANPAAIPDMRLEQTDEGLFLTAALEFELPTLAEDALRLVHRFGIVGAHRGTGLPQLLQQAAAGGFAHVVGIRLEGQAP